MYTVTNFKSKKELKEAVAAYNAALALYAECTASNGVIVKVK